MNLFICCQVVTIIYGDLLIRKVGINSYIYVNDQDQYKKHHIIYNITNELLTDYIANILNLQITGKQISSDQRCFFELSFDDYINRQLEKKHFNQEDVILAYFENDISFFEDVSIIISVILKENVILLFVIINNLIKNGIYDLLLSYKVKGGKSYV